MMLESNFVNTSMSFQTHCDTLPYVTTEAPEFIDITDDVSVLVLNANIRNGVVVVYSHHTTAAIKINESEPELMKDMARFLAQIAPVDGEYCHNDFDVRTVNMTEDECPNAHSHCQHLLLGTSESIPLINGRLALGRWQRIFLVELDRSKTRQVTVQVLGA